MTRKRRAGSRAKKQAMFQHAKTRAAERYGVLLTKSLHNEIVLQIKSGASIFLHAQSGSRKIHKVCISDCEWATVVYDPTRQALRTFLHPNHNIKEMLENVSELTGGDSCANGKAA